MTNKLIKNIGGKKVGFFLGTMAAADYFEATGRPIHLFLEDIQDSGKNHNKIFASFLKATADAYQDNFGDGSTYEVKEIYRWMDEAETDDWVEFLRELFNVPKTEEVAEEGK